MQWRGAYIVECRVGANDYRVKMRSKTKMYHVNVLKKYIARGPEVNVIPTSTYKLGEDLSEDQQCILDLIWRRRPDVFPDMP